MATVAVVVVVAAARPAPVGATKAPRTARARRESGAITKLMTILATPGPLVPLAVTSHETGARGAIENVLRANRVSVQVLTQPVVLHGVTAQAALRHKALQPPMRFA